MPVYVVAGSPQSVEAGSCVTKDSPLTAYKEPRYGVVYNGYSRLFYCEYSAYFTVDWSDLNINVLNTANALQCARCAFERSNTPGSGSPADDNAPATFDYWNTPSWAEVGLGYYGQFRWGSSSPIRFATRAGTEIAACDSYYSPSWSQWSQFAGPMTSYHPSWGFTFAHAWTY